MILKQFYVVRRIKIPRINLKRLKLRIYQLNRCFPSIVQFLSLFCLFTPFSQKGKLREEEETTKIVSLCSFVVVQRGSPNRSYRRNTEKGYILQYSVVAVITNTMEFCFESRGTNMHLDRTLAEKSADPYPFQNGVYKRNNANIYQTGVYRKRIKKEAYKVGKRSNSFTFFLLC